MFAAAPSLSSALRLLALLGVSGVLSGVMTLAQAQPSGLQLLKGRSEGLMLKAEEPGFRLRFTETPAQLQDVLSAQTTRQTLSAEWSLPVQGLYSSAGLSWSQTSAPGSAASSSFLALGWQGSLAPQSRWIFSADVGTAVSSEGKCAGIGQACLHARPLGINPDSRGNGLHLNPYVSFGATYRFGQ
jgi:hypothetical protein